VVLLVALEDNFAVKAHIEQAVELRIAQVVEPALTVVAVAGVFPIYLPTNYS
jgi:hypothetical protein